MQQKERLASDLPKETTIGESSPARSMFLGITNPGMLVPAPQDNIDKTQVLTNAISTAFSAYRGTSAMRNLYQRRLGDHRSLTQ